MSQQEQTETPTPPDPAPFPNRDDYLNLGYTVDELRQIKGFVKPELARSNNDLYAFLRKAKVLGLDILAEEITAQPRRDREGNIESWQHTVSIEAKRRKADETGCYVPGRQTVYRYTEGGELFSATAFVNKYVHGSWHETPYEAFYNEYVQTYKDRKTGQMVPNKFWATKPHLMLAKCAESGAIGRAFPILSKVYIEEEMGRVMNEEEEETFDRETGEITPPKRGRQPRRSESVEEEAVELLKNRGGRG